MRMLRRKLCITKTPSSGFPSNVTLLLPGRLRNPASSSLPHVADFNGIRHRWDLRDPQLAHVRIAANLVHQIQAGSASPSTFAVHLEEYLRPLGCSEFPGSSHHGNKDSAAFSFWKRVERLRFEPSSASRAVPLERADSAAARCPYGRMVCRRARLFDIVSCPPRGNTLETTRDPVLRSDRFYYHTV